MHIIKILSYIKKKFYANLTCDQNKMLQQTLNNNIYIYMNFQSKYSCNNLEIDQVNRDLSINSQK